jgi:nucleoside-diphosphate-sugar epimerase
MKRIIITGGSGFIATNAINFFLKKKYKITVFTRKKKIPERKNLKIFTTDKNYNNIFKNKSNINLILHLAGNASVIKSQKKKIQYRKNQIQISKNLVKFLGNKESIIVFVSSYAVYGKNNILPSKEDNKLKPVSKYGEDKVLLERFLINETANKKIKLIIIRFSSVYGPYLKKQVFWDISTKIKDKNKKSINLFGTGSEKRDFIHVDDALNAINLLLNKANQKVEIVNCGSGKIYTVKFIADLIKKNMFSNKQIIFDKINSSISPKIMHLNISKIKKINWASQINIFQGVKNYVKWFVKL